MSHRRERLLPSTPTETAWAEIWRDVSWLIYRSPQGIRAVDKPLYPKQRRPDEELAGTIDRVSRRSALAMAKRIYA